MSYRNRLRKKQRRQERTYNRFAKDLPEIAVGEECQVHRFGQWQRAVVVKRTGPKGRSYVLRTTEGREIRRNRKDIKKDFSDMDMELTTEKEDERGQNKPQTATNE